MLSFRKKIFLSDIALLFVFVLLLLPIGERKVDIGVGFFIMSIVMLFLYSLMTWWIIHRFTDPIRQITDAILPYQEGREEFLPQIVLTGGGPKDEFDTLAATLNSLTDRIQKQIEHLTLQKKETEGILESLKEGVIAINKQGKVIFANPTACHLLGAPPGAILGLALNKIHTQSPDFSKKCQDVLLAALDTAEPATQTWVFREKAPLYLDLISAPLAHGTGALLVLQDKTSDYKMVEMGKDFIANASHELRTPVTIIRGFAETLQDMPNISPDLLHDITEKIVRTCVRLDKLVNSLLTLSDIENMATHRFQTTDLVSLSENCLHLLRTANPGVSLSFKSELERAPVHSEADLLELAILNLLENAVKYSPQPAKIEVTLLKVGPEIHLRISDQGIGISEADIPQVFGRFYTVDKARSRKQGGVGLGLSMVKTIVEKHRGTVSLQSELDKGSTFVIALPLEN